MISLRPLASVRKKKLQRGGHTLFLQRRSGPSGQRNPFDSEVAMLSALKKKFRLKAALALAALYAVCVVAPHAALALTGDAVHCLTEAHGSAHMHKDPTATKNHVHSDGVTHSHHDTGLPEVPSDTGDKSHSGNCCGLFCVTALVHEPPLVISTPPAALLVGPGEFYRLAGRGPDRINRPPIG